MGETDLRILIIDDEKTMRKGLTYLLEQLALETKIVGEAKNGLEGLKKMELLKPDYAFIDIRMPIMDGLELIKVWNQKDISSNTKCIMLTAHSEISYAQQALRFRASDFLLKPIDEHILQELFNRLEKQNDQKPSKKLGTKIMKKYMKINNIRNQLVIDILNFVANNYMRDIQISDIANNLRVTPNYISSQFKKHTAENFTSFLNYYRIEIAKLIIKEYPNYKINEISYIVGFNNDTYFHKIFKSLTGTTPNLYSRRINKNE